MAGGEGIDSKSTPPAGDAAARHPALGIVLVEPEIPGNTGSIGRLAMATGCRLHLVGKLGFKTDDHHLRRAGMDYWRHADVHYHDSFARLCAELGSPRFHLLTAQGSQPYTAIPFQRGDLIVFGCESVGLPPELIATHRDRAFYIPMWNAARSHNLANAVSIVLYEGLRQLRCF
jgi:tRNA (cytidine/uridine-2'-O-)-methyltransferase